MYKFTLILNKNCQNSNIAHNMMKTLMGITFGGVTISECTGVWYENGVEYSDDNILYTSYCTDYTHYLYDFYTSRISDILSTAYGTSQELSIMYTIDEHAFFYNDDNRGVHI